MYQNYNSILNPLEKHFQNHEVISKRNNALAYIATFALGAFIGIVIYRWIESNRDEDYDVKFREDNE